MTVEVLPMGSGWRVTVYGRHHSKHRLKSRAVEEGKRVAKKGSHRLKVHRANGTYQYGRNYTLNEEHM